MKRTIAFHSNQLSMRGTEVALFDYASYNEVLLNNNSVIYYNALSPHNDSQVLDKFRQRFEVIAYDNRSNLDDLLSQQRIDLLYAIKSGKKDGLISKVVPTMVHAVFPTSPSQVHGASYAFISEWLSQQCADNQIPSVPHIVSLPHIEDDLRLSLRIPENALVMGNHGGRDNFDVTCALQAVQQLLEQHPEIYFLGLNLAPFIDHPRAIFLPGSTDILHKTRFINTCDLMIHARRQGESFGLACGEFSIRNKPVLTYAYGKHTHHRDVLGKKGFYYKDRKSLVALVQSMNQTHLKSGDWDCYTQRYNPAHVMSLFDQYLISPALRPGGRPPNIAAQLAYFKLKLKMRINRLRPD